MKYFLIISSLFIYISVIANGQDTTFYYAGDHKIKLTPIENKLLIKFEKGKEVKDESEFISKYYSSLATDEVKRIKGDVYFIHSTKEKAKSIMETLRSHKDIKTIYFYYLAEGGGELGLTDEILFNALPSTTEEELEELHKKYNTSVVEKTELYQKIEVVKDSNTIDIANKYYEEGLFEYVEPNFYVTMEPSSNYEQNKQIMTINIKQNLLKDEITVVLELTETSQINISIFNLLGTISEVLFNQRMEVGAHSFDLSSYQLNSGLYYLVLTTEKERFVKPFILVK